MASSLTQQNDSVLDKGLSARKRVSKESIKTVRKAFWQSPTKLILTAARQLPQSTVNKAFRHILRFCAYKVQQLLDIYM